MMRLFTAVLQFDFELIYNQLKFGLLSFVTEYFLFQQYISLFQLFVLTGQFLNQCRLLVNLLLVLRANSLQPVLIVTEDHLRMFIFLQQTGKGCSGRNHFCDFIRHSLIFIFLVILITASFMLNKQVCAIFDHNNSFVQFFYPICAALRLHLAQIKPYFSQVGIVMLDFIPLTWFKIVILHSSQLTLFNFFLEQVAFFEQQINLTQQSGYGLRVKAIWTNGVLWTVQFNSKVRIEQKQLFISPAIDSDFNFNFIDNVINFLFTNRLDVFCFLIASFCRGVIMVCFVPWHFLNLTVRHLLLLITNYFKRPKHKSKE